MDLNKNIADAEALQRQSNSAGLGFIDTELDTSLTFANVALEAGEDAEKKERNRANARVGYDTVLRFMNRLDPSEIGAADFVRLTEKLAALKSALAQLGEKLI